jgi:hypothetical protein
MHAKIKQIETTKRMHVHAAASQFCMCECGSRMHVHAGVYQGRRESAVLRLHAKKNKPKSMHAHACGNILWEERRRVHAVSCACGGSRQTASHVHAQPLARFSREHSTSKRRCILPQQPYLLCLYKETRTHAHKEGRNTLKPLEETS